MLKSLLRDRLLVILLVLTLAIRLFSINEEAVEALYSKGVYPYISAALRALFGWIPFSLGDFLYLGAGGWIAYSLYRLFKKRPTVSKIILRFVKLSLGIYVLFNLLWGLNYNRPGIAKELGLNPVPYTEQDLVLITTELIEGIKTVIPYLDSARRLKLADQPGLIFKSADYAFERETLTGVPYAFRSIKPSLYSALGHYIGFTGYYNPFTGEAQLKTTVPVFIKSFIVCHEIAHQLGYAKENEANLVGYLVGRNSQDPEMIYSAYFDLLEYSFRELFATNLPLGLALMQSTPQRYKTDRKIYYKYLYNSRNQIAPVFGDMYDQYLKLNNQPKGKQTYNEVVAWLISYRKKYGSI